MLPSLTISDSVFAHHYLRRRRSEQINEEVEKLIYSGTQRKLDKVYSLHADIGWPTGNGKKLSNSQECCLAQLCQAAA